MTHNYDFDSFMGSSKREETAQKLDTSNNHKAADTISRRNVRSGGNIGLWQKGKMDITFLSLVMILMSVGLICLFSSSYAFALSNYNDSYHFIKKQAIFTVIGIGAMLFASKVNYHIYRRFAWIIYFATIAMLIIVLILPPMSEDLNFHRWLYIGSFSFQPSEIAKFSIVLLFAHLISK